MTLTQKKKKECDLNGNRPDKAGPNLAWTTPSDQGKSLSLVPLIKPPHACLIDNFFANNTITIVSHLSFLQSQQKYVSLFEQTLLKTRKITTHWKVSNRLARVHIIYFHHTLSQ